MKSRQLFIALALTLTGLVLALALPQVARADGPIYVDRDAPGPTHDGLSWATAYTDVQDGLDAALPGDELWVAEGSTRRRTRPTPETPALPPLS